MWRLALEILSEPAPRQRLEEICSLEHVKHLLQTCKKIVVLTGAGVRKFGSTVVSFFIFLEKLKLKRKFNLNQLKGKKNIVQIKLCGLSNFLIWAIKNP